MTTCARLTKLLGTARPVARGVRRRARIGFSLLAQRARGGTLFVLVSGHTTQGISAALRAVRLARKMRIPADVLVLDFVPVPILQEALNKFPADVPVLRFWRDAAPVGGGAAPRHSTATLRPAPLPDLKERGKWRAGYYRAGQPVLAITERGQLTLIEHFGPGAAPVCRDEIDERGKLVRVVDLHPGTGREVTHRYFDAEGACWFSVDVEAATGALDVARRHRPHPHEFASYRDAQAEWIAQLLGRTATRPSRILAVDKISRTVARTLGAHVPVHSEASPRNLQKEKR